MFPKIKISAISLSFTALSISSASVEDKFSGLQAKTGSTVKTLLNFFLFAKDKAQGMMKVLPTLKKLNL